MTSIVAETSEPNVPAVDATNNGPADSAGPAVKGTSPAAGVWGQSTNWQGVVGQALASSSQNGVWGESFGPGFGVYGTTKTGGAGVRGEDTGSADQAGPGVHGSSAAAGVLGVSSAWQGVVGQALESSAQSGVWGETFGSGCGVYGVTKTGAAAIRGEHQAGGLAGHFIGNVEVTGNIVVHGDVQLSGADLAEEFEIAGMGGADPGSVVVLAGDERVRLSDLPYDRRVAGVISGAGTCRPGVVLNRPVGGADRFPLALTGRTWCKVDADHAPIRAGDILTTSSTRGHAMRAVDPIRAFGAIIGKALTSVQSGRALIPVLVALQ